MTEDAVVAKFMASATMAWPVERCDRVRRAVLDLENITTAELMAELRAQAR